MQLFKEIFFWFDIGLLIFFLVAGFIIVFRKQ
jgi:hypothetical protein